MFNVLLVILILRHGGSYIARFPENSPLIITHLVFVDINECEQRDTCQHECMNTPGSHRCLCPSGYRLMTNGKTCQGKK